MFVGWPVSGVRGGGDLLSFLGAENLSFFLSWVADAQFNHWSIRPNVNFALLVPNSFAL